MKPTKDLIKQRIIQMIYEYRKRNYYISTDKRKLQPTVIHRFLTNSYWAKGCTYSNIKRRIKNSFCFGVYHNKKQVGFCRVISDTVTFSYLADVFIIEEYRGKGLSKWLMKCVMSHPEIGKVDSWMLKTKDAHELYEKLGFKRAEEPKKIMEKQYNK